MFSLELADTIEVDTQASYKIIAHYFERLQKPEKSGEWIERFDREFDKLRAILKETPKRWQVYQFKPPLKTHHEYRAAQVGWFTVFWWVDDDARICHVYRILDSKQDFSKAGEW